MKRFLYSLLCTLLCVAANAQFDSAPAFPGAEGYGRYTTGGRGGTVYHVTTLEDYCDNTDYSPEKTKDSEIVGSLRYAVKKSGARIIVFDVAGTIELKAPLKIQNDDITILGQTAPGDGICLKNYTVNIAANNVIIRYIRCRLGNDGRRYYSSGTELSGSDQIVEDDAMNAYQKTGSEKHNIIIDHCSISWSVDECGSFYGNQDFTLQWCMLTESLRNAGHTKGNHGYGGIWGGERASFHHNLLANHDSRNPRFDHGYVSTLAGPVDYTNNVLYNWGSNSAYGGENKPGETSKKFNIINNYYRYGGATSDKDRLLNPTTYCTNCNSSSGTNIVPGTFYISGNYMYGSSTVTNDNTCSSAIQMDSKGKSYSDWKSGYVSTTKFKATTQDFSSYNTISQHTAENTYDKVLQYAGASLSRDAVDTRVCNDAKNGTTSYTTSTGKGTNGATGGFIDMPSDVGGYPTLTGTMATDTDGDGIPDEWEDAHNLDKNDASDALTYTLDTKHGYYTNLEVYANYLVQHITKAERAGATETFTEYYPLDSNDPAPTQTVITASSESVNITGTANTTVTLSSNNTSGAYSITSQPNASVATASISGNTITLTGVAAGSTSLTVTQAATTGYTSATKTINITVSAQGTTSTIFSLNVTSSNTLSLAYQESSSIDSYATIEGGSASVYNGKNSETAQNMVSSKAVNLGGSSASYLKITLNNAIAAGDVITITNAGNWKVSTSNSISGAAAITTPYTVKSTDAFVGESNLYIFKTGTSGDPSAIKEITITRSSNSGDTPGQTSTDSEVTALSIDMTSVSIPVGTAALVKANVTTTNNSKTGVNISAADGTIVKTYSTGAIIGVKPGTTTVTFASAYGGLTKTCEVTVTAPGTTGYTKNGSWYIVDKGSKQGLINAIGQINLDSSSDNKYIFLPNGTYDLGAMGMTTIMTKKVSIIGESEDGVIIKSKLTNGTDGTSYEGLGSATTLLNRGSDLYLQDITIQNAMNYYNGGGRAACLQDEGTSTVAKRVKLLSYQDTYYSHKEGAKYYWEDSEIHGTVDFMCGSSSVFYNRCLLYAESRESTAGRGQCTLTAPAGNNTDKGYCFYDCTIDANCESFDLGRAWKNGANSVYINTTFKSTKIVADWFTLKGMSENVVAGTFSTYGSKKSDGSSFAPNSSSKTFSDSKGGNSVTKNIVMTASEAANYTLDKFFTDWQPDQVAAQKTMSTPSASGKTISWSAVSEAAGYLIEKDGELVGITTGTSYTVDEDGTYTVRAANARGGFGEGVEVVVGNAPRTVFELDFEEASDNNYGFTGNCTFSQSTLSDGTHCLHVNQGGGSGDRTANINLAVASKEFTTVTNYTFEFDWGLHVANQNTSTTTLLAGSETLLTITTPNYGTSTLTAGSVNVTIPNNGYNNQSPCPTTLSHFVITSSADGTYLTVKSNGNILVDNVKIANGLKNITALNTTLGRALAQMALDNIQLTTTDPEVPTYTVSFNAGEHGTCGTEQLEEEVAGAGVILPEATPNTGYIFDGWYDGDTKVGNAGENYKPTANITLTAHYTAIPVTSVTVSPASKTIEVGETLQLSAQILPSSASQNITWSSSDATKAEVSASGLVKAKATGTVQITATAGDKSDFCMVTVIAKQSGGTETIYSWESPNGTVIQSGGVITETSSTDRINYKNTALGTDYYTISLTGSNDYSTQYMTIALSGSETIKKDDVIRVTAYRNKNASNYSSAKFKFANDATMVIGGNDGKDFVNLNASGDTPNATEPNTLSHTVTEAEAGGNTLMITRGTTGTNLFITKIEIVRESSAPSTPATITKYISSAGWASFVPSENVVVPEEVKVYYAKDGSYNGSSVVAVPVETGQTIAKNTGFFVNGSEGNHEFAVSATTPLTINDNMLSCGANSPITDGSLVFGRNNINDVLTVGFFPLASYDISLPEGVVYIDGTKLPQYQQQTKAISVVFDDDKPTFIQQTENRNQNANVQLYNLSGQKVNSNYKGIVIINGRKVWKR